MAISAPELGQDHPPSDVGDLEVLTDADLLDNFTGIELYLVSQDDERRIATGVLPQSAKQVLVDGGKYPTTPQEIVREAWTQDYSGLG